MVLKLWSVCSHRVTCYVYTYTYVSFLCLPSLADESSRAVNLTNLGREGF